MLGATAREATGARQGHSSCPRARKAWGGQQGPEPFPCREGRTEKRRAAAAAEQLCLATLQPRAAAAQQKPAQAAAEGGRDSLGGWRCPHTLPQHPGSEAGSAPPHQLCRCRCARGSPFCGMRAAFPAGSGRVTLPEFRPPQGRWGHHVPPAPSRQELALGEPGHGFISPHCHGERAFPCASG